MTRTQPRTMSMGRLIHHARRPILADSSGLQFFRDIKQTKLKVCWFRPNQLPVHSDSVRYGTGASPRAKILQPKSNEIVLRSYDTRRGGVGGVRPDTNEAVKV